MKGDDFFAAAELEFSCQNWSDLINWIDWEGLEPECQATDTPLGRPDDQQLVVDGRIDCPFVERVPNREQNLPPGGAEIHERQRMMDLDVKARIVSRPIRAG